MTHTRYSAGNVLMLVAGVVICLINTFFTVMGSAFGVDIFPGFRGFCTAAFIYIALLMLPAFLIMFRWSRIGTVAMWSVTICCLLLAFGGRQPAFVPTLIFLLLVSIMCSAIDPRDEEADLHITNRQ